MSGRTPQLMAQQTSEILLKGCVELTKAYLFANGSGSEILMFILTITSTIDKFNYSGVERSSLGAGTGDRGVEAERGGGGRPRQPANRTGRYLYF
jgi:hypothetical protein